MRRMQDRWREHVPLDDRRREVARVDFGDDEPSVSDPDAEVGAVVPHVIRLTVHGGTRGVCRD